MQLYEFQAKQIFKEFRVPVAKGRLATTVESAVQVANEIGRPVAVKAQVLTGGRGLSGGIQFGSDPAEVRKIASVVLNTPLRGERPLALLVEEKFEPMRELYAAVTWDYQHKCPVMIASSRGGVDIEAIAKEHPGDVSRTHIDLFKGFSSYQGRMLAAKIGLAASVAVQYSNILNALWNIFEKHDAELVETNPLALLADGTLVALDAKLNLDDKSIHRQSDLIGRIDKMPEALDGFAQRRVHARELGIPTYIEMNGNIGVISDGAGSGMLALDLVADFGGKTRIYCEMGGEITPELMGRTMMVCLMIEGVKVLLINLLGGANRMDEMAIGITTYLASHPAEVPILVRMSGTRQEEGRKMLVDSGIAFFDNPYEAAEKAVDLSRGL
jgi:succinyl-CoA synthetase beta subunit